MGKYKFFGNAPCSMAGVVEFSQFGQVAELSDQAALDILKAGGGIITAEDFDAIDFPAEMIRQRKRRTGPEYMAFHEQALIARERLLAELEVKTAVLA